MRRRRVGGAGLASLGAPSASVAEAAKPDEDILLGESLAIAGVRALIRRAAPTQASVLICGEAGTGKSLIARTLHRQSPRAAGPFICLDLLALTAEGEAEGTTATAALFGDAGGRGALADAQGGVLVLDEVAALAPTLQSRLLAALEAGRIDARLIATTRRPRGALNLRQELLGRLNTVEMALPPLRARGEDAAIIAEHFLRLFASRHGRPQKSLSAEAVEAIVETGWPGEVRGLRQAMERCVIFSDGARYEADEIRAAASALSDRPAEALAPSSLSLAETERALVAAALKRASFNVSHAAKALGLTRAALYRRMAKHGL